jgi:hypothetical protein
MKVVKQIEEAHMYIMHFLHKTDGFKIVIYECANVPNLLRCACITKATHSTRAKIDEASYPSTLVYRYTCM